MKLSLKNSSPSPFRLLFSLMSKSFLSEFRPTSRISLHIVQPIQPRRRCHIYAPFVPPKLLLQMFASLNPVGQMHVNLRIAFLTGQTLFLRSHSFSIFPNVHPFLQQIMYVLHTYLQAESILALKYWRFLPKRSTLEHL